MDILKNLRRFFFSPATLGAMASLLILLPVLYMVLKGPQEGWDVSDWLIVGNEKQSDSGTTEEIQAEAREGEPAEAETVAIIGRQVSFSKQIPDQDVQLISTLHDYFGVDIVELGRQVEMLDKLFAYLKHQYPGESWDALEAIIRSAYPAQAKELLDLAKKLGEYRQWFEDQQDFSGYTGAERREIIWQMRMEIFGVQAAEEIWNHELRNETITDAMKRIGQLEGTSLQEKMDYLLESIDSVYDEGVDLIGEDLRLSLLNVFLGLDGVQVDLHAASAAERADSLLELRRAIGYDDAAISRLTELDAIRDERWSAGQQYLQERQRIVADYQGAEQTQQLKQLGRDYFGDEAGTIEAELQAGFNRFEQKRIYGKN
ncbi:hypothetical protein [Desulfosediminicola ganghwensis]|uniref:hypothetical protein n=1 Tax=Desulfosediminicola ganghwensis TaxID=2569540 RepID=UPI0010AB9EE1|nr:hypothetical protein [Desulfosediminicola ganghwensis]